MIDFYQFRNYILVPALKSVNYQNFYNEEAVTLLLATMAQESSFGEYLLQVGDSIAKGPFQMEDSTYQDLVSNYLLYRQPLRLEILKSLNMQSMPAASELISNLKLACLMARVFYLRCPGALPAVHDKNGQWNYYKLHWNTEKGAATKEEFMENYTRYIK